MNPNQKDIEHPASLPDVKTEPPDHNLPNLDQNPQTGTPDPPKADQSSCFQRLKGDPFQDHHTQITNNAHHPQTHNEPQSLPMDKLSINRGPKSTYRQYKCAGEIEYSPENALEEGVAMVNDLSSRLNKIDIGSNLRKDVWDKEVDTLLKQKPPQTMIAICGATGAGKSTLLNAVLDDNIVPTSGLRACTAVVTEISYQKEKTIDANVSFLSMEEWRHELSILLEDMADEGGTIRHFKDMCSEAGIAWYKVHAVYPLLKPKQLVGMSAEQIIQSSPETAKVLGTIKKICAPTSKKFAVKISKYLDSGDKKQSGKRKKGKKVEKAKAKAMEIEMGNENGNERGKDKEGEEPEPELWPLIRLVQIRCPSEALSKGAVLVDLPGVADANMARSSIAKEYIKRCEHIWIAAPIARAVDDKTATDLLGDAAFKTQLLNGNFDDSRITYITTKTDDISCSEIIQNLEMFDDPALMELDDKIDELTARQTVLVNSNISVTRRITVLEKEKEPINEIMCDLRRHLNALKKGELYISPLKTKETHTRKRSPFSCYGLRPAKRQKVNPPGNDNTMSEDENTALFKMSNDIGSDLEANSESGSESDGEHSCGDDSENESRAFNKEGGSSDAMDEVQEKEEGEEVTEESLMMQFKKLDDGLKLMDNKIKGFNAVKEERKHSIIKLKQDIQILKKEKAAFCALKRNEYACEVIKEDFRSNLRKFDEETAEKENPDAFDPTQPHRELVKRDSDPSCFSNKDDTGIPALQRWCHEITVGPRERVVKKFLHHFATFLQQVSSYVSDGVGAGVSIQDRITLRDRWATKESCAGAAGELNRAQSYRLSDSCTRNSVDEERFKLCEDLADHGKRARDRRKQGTGNACISERLQRTLLHITDRNVEELREKFRTDLADKCQTGADNSEKAALVTSSNFANSTHWQTYRATLRRLGEFKGDLNRELVSPLTKEIASPWARVFESDLFGPMNQAITAIVQNLIKEVEETAPPGLKDRCKTQGQLSLRHAEFATKRLIAKLKSQMNNEQKEISRCIAPRVRNEFSNGYEEASLEKGPGSVARQKDKFHQFVESKQSTVFTDLSNHIIGRLDSAVDDVQTVVDDAVDSLSKKVEVSLAVLWEVPKADEEQYRLRKELVGKLGTLEGLVKMWMDVSALRAVERREGR